MRFAKPVLPAILFLLMIFCLAAPAYGAAAMVTEVYVGILQFPDTIGGMTVFNEDKLAGGLRLESKGDTLGFVIDFMTGVALVDYYYGLDYTSDFPVFLSCGLVLSPSPGFFQPYLTAGLGVSLIWLELSSAEMSGEYIFFHGYIGAGIRLSFGGDGGFFAEYRKIFTKANDDFPTFEMPVYTLGWEAEF